jgi:hypothetical protein
MPEYKRFRGKQKRKTARASASIETPLEAELLDLLGGGRDARIVARYLGFDGRGGRTLRSVGSEFGITHERVRQIKIAALERLRLRRRFTPALDRTLTFVVGQMPGLAEEIETKMQSERLSRGTFRLEGVINAANLLGRNLQFSVKKVDGERLVHSANRRAVEWVMHVAQRAVEHVGLANISEVAAEARTADSGVTYSKSLIESILFGRKGFRWLDRSRGWFWFSEFRRNPILSRVRKMLSVANPVRASDLCAGIARDYRMRGFSAPREIILELCRQAQGLRVADNNVRVTSAIRPGDVLDEAEVKIASALSQNGGVMSRSKLEALCLDMGVNRSTFYHHLTYSPILSNCAAGVYGLIGSQPPHP